MSQVRRRIATWLDYTAPVAFGVRLWLDCLFGYKPTADDQPEIVA